MRIEVRPKDPKISQIQSSAMISSLSTNRKSPFEGSGGCLGSHSSHQNRSYPGEKRKTVAHQMFLAFRGLVFCPTKLKQPWTRFCYHHCFGFFLGKPPKVDNDSHLRLAELETAEAWSCVVKSSAGRLRCAALQV